MSPFCVTPAGTLNALFLESTQLICSEQKGRRSKTRTNPPKSWSGRSAKAANSSASIFTSPNNRVCKVFTETNERHFESVAAPLKIRIVCQQIVSWDAWSILCVEECFCWDIGPTWIETFYGMVPCGSAREVSWRICSCCLSAPQSLALWTRVIVNFGTESLVRMSFFAVLWCGWTYQGGAVDHCDWLTKVLYFGVRSRANSHAEPQEYFRLLSIWLSVLTARNALTLKKFGKRRLTCGEFVHPTTRAQFNESLKSCMGVGVTWDPILFLSRKLVSFLRKMWTCGNQIFFLQVCGCGCGQFQNLIVVKLSETRPLQWKVVEQRARETKTGGFVRSSSVVATGQSCQDSVNQILRVLYSCSLYKNPRNWTEQCLKCPVSQICVSDFFTQKFW